MKKIIVLLALLLYTILLAQILIFKNIPVIRFAGMILNFGGTQDGPANLTPFKSIGPYLLGHRGFLGAVLNIGGNIGLLVPVGFMAPLVRPNLGWSGISVLALAAGLSIEASQALFHLGIFDVDDLLLNGLGVLVGFGFYRFMISLFPERM